MLSSFISPYRAERDMIRSLVPNGEFLEVFVDTPIEECMRRDPKGLYAKARAGTLKAFTGVSDPYEVPGDAEIVLNASVCTPLEAAREILIHLARNGFIHYERSWSGA